MPDYTKHLLKNWEWSDEYRSRMGKEAYWKYVHEIYNMLLSRQPDSFFSIKKNVKPENVDLFIKVCCMFILEQSLSTVRRNFRYTFNRDCTEIRYVELHFLEKKQ